MSADVLARWLAALADPTRAGDALADDVRIERFAPMARGTSALAPEEAFVGLVAAIAWLRRTPSNVGFALAGEPVAIGDRLEVEYVYRTPDFENGGTWIVRIVDDKIAMLQHRPYQI